MVLLMVSKHTYRLPGWIGGALGFSVQMAVMQWMADSANKSVGLQVLRLEDDCATPAIGFAAADQ